VVCSSVGSAYPGQMEEYEKHEEAREREREG